VAVMLASTSAAAVATVGLAAAVTTAAGAVAAAAGAAACRSAERVRISCSGFRQSEYARVCFFGGL
jgi:hypothetical protein